MTDNLKKSVFNGGVIDDIIWHEAPLVLMRLNAGDLIGSCNPYTLQLTGMDFTGLPLSRAFLDFSPEPVPLDVQAMTANHVPLRFMLPTSCGMPANLLFRFIATPEGEVLAIGWHDMPEVTNLQEQLIELNNELNYVTRTALKDLQFQTERQAATHLRILESAGEGICSLDAEGRPSFVNSAAAATLGYSLKELVGKPSYAAWYGLHPDGSPRDQAESPIHRSLTQGIAHRVDDDYFQHKDGQFLPVAFTSSPIIDHRKVVGAVVTFRDISERKQTEMSQRLSASVFANSYEGITITNADNLIIDVNPAFLRITGYSRDEVIGKNPGLLSSGRQGPEFYARMWESLKEHDFWQGEIWNRRKNGEVYAEMLSISLVRDNKGELQQHIGIFSDITYLKTHEAELNRIAHYDTLTGVPNRRLLSDRLEQAIVRSRRSAIPMALCYLDLDGFKAINDQHGHGVGDQLLIALTLRMKDELREGDTLARVGGDEFVVVLSDFTDVADSVPMLERLLAAASRPVMVGDLALQISASIGVTFYSQAEEVDADLLLRQADQAMYQAKLAGRNRYHIFDAEQDRSVRDHHESVERIRLALAANEFVLYYQPKVNMRTGEVIGVEALIRWQHPELGLLLPALFLPTIEEHPLAIAIGEWVINTALTQIRLWRTEGLGIPVSVNVGALQLLHPDFISRLRGILAVHPDIRAGDLELEVLETSAIEDLAQASLVIEACRKLGVVFALDDFGTGYSSLTYLKRLPVSHLKIDQSFVRNMLGDPNDLAILEGVLGLATAFRRQVIAEGVETEEHGAMLLQLGCELAQGFGIARPMPAVAVPVWVKDWRPDPAWAGLSSINREDLPLLFAGIEHRSWIATMESCLLSNRQYVPADHLQCRLGQWLENEGLVRYGAHPRFLNVGLLHRAVHALADELINLQARDQNQEALTRIPELHEFRDALLEQLKMLWGDPPQGNPPVFTLGNTRIREMA
ncbi:MAG: EAL domain-containing protein [Betaproteobacteria bacterium]